MAPEYLVRRDTSAWVFQTWTSFAVSIVLAAIGVWHIPNDGLERTMLSIGFFFCLSSALTLAKTIRDNREDPVDTPAWMVQVWAAFAIANVLTGWGVYRLTIEGWQKGYMVATWLYMLTTSFTLAKTIRDNHEADLLESSRPEKKSLTA